MVNRTNFLLVKKYLSYLSEVMQVANTSVGRYRFYLRHLLLWADDTLLSQAPCIRPTFPVYVSKLNGRQGTGQLAACSQKKIIGTAKRFFLWAKTSGNRLYRAIPVHWIETLRPPPTQPQIGGDNEYVSLEDVLCITSLTVESENLALRRDKAAAALLFLTGARAGAFTSLPVSAVNISDRTIRQWPELGVKTKNGKRATTNLLPIPELIEVAEDWDKFIRTQLPLTAPWYTPINNQWGEHTLSQEVPGKNRNQALNKRLRVLYKAAGLPYKSAHKFRHGHAVYGLTHAKTMADYKAVSMNLMHEDIKITDQIYAPLRTSEVKDRIANLGSSSDTFSANGFPLDINGLNNTQIVQMINLLAQRLSS